MKAPKESSVIVCSIVRDAATAVKHNIPIISEICGHFAQYTVIVFENDSKDSTRDLLERWSASDSNVVLVPFNPQEMSESEALSPGVNPFFSKRRISKMAYLRNRYMNYIKKEAMSADYMMVVDLDVSKISVNGVLSCFENGHEWDAVCANGWSTGPRLRRRYHDTYALVEWENRNKPQTESMIEELSRKYAGLKVGDPWVKVMSGFGGIAFYRFELVQGLEYHVLPNDDEAVEVRCEHYSIYSQLLQKGASSFYINPSMLIKYQDINLSIILNHLKRKFSKLL